jgi:SET domain-containing protein 6
MVPVGDILNHIAKNNAQLRFEKDQLLICATRDIQKGEELFNTYGEQSNNDLLHMYGFVERYPENVYDSVEVPTKHLISAIRTQKNDREDVIDKKIEAMQEAGLIDETTSLIIGMDGILNEEETLHMLQVRQNISKIKKLCFFKSFAS